MTLRRTLVVLQIGLLTVGMIAFAAISYHFYRASEMRSLRATLDSSSGSLQFALCQQVRRSEASLDQGVAAACAFSDGAPGGSPDDGSGEPAPMPSATTAVLRSSTVSCRSVGGYAYPNLIAGSFVELRTAAGRTVSGGTYRVPFVIPDPLEQGRTTTTTTATTAASASCPDPALPSVLTVGASGTRYIEVGAHSGAGPFLVQITRLVPAQGSATSGPILVTGIPETSLTQSLHNLLLLDVVVGAAVLALLAGSTLLVVRSSLRPLERITATAKAISAGDLSRRAPADERSEVGQLGTAFNRMLTRIEGAFAERDATEMRLRQFLADASHELRTPLTSIRGFAELWRIQHRPAAGDGTPGEGAAPPIDARAAMARIEHHALVMSGMLEELLLLARLDESPDVGRAGRAGRDVVELGVIAAEACDAAAALDPAREIRLDARSRPNVVGDPVHLRRAATNLAVNAVRHTPSGSPIEVSVHADGAVAELVVRDHGPGLDADGLQHAFDRFWQADASRATGGSGLGLAIVAGIAAEHGGSATVANAPDGGAVFTIRLPLAGVG